MVETVKKKKKFFFLEKMMTSIEKGKERSKYVWRNKQKFLCCSFYKRWAFSLSHSCNVSFENGSIKFILLSFFIFVYIRSISRFSHPFKFDSHKKLFRPKQKQPKRKVVKILSSINRIEFPFRFSIGKSF